MARYLGTAAGRTEGAAIGKAGFTRAKVFTTRDKRLLIFLLMHRK